MPATENKAILPGFYFAMLKITRVLCMTIRYIVLIRLHMIICSVNNKNFQYVPNGHGVTSSLRALINRAIASFT